MEKEFKDINEEEFYEYFNSQMDIIDKKIDIIDKKIDIIVWKLKKN